VTACTLCDLPTPDPPLSDDGVAGAFCCRGCLEVARRLDDPGTADAETAADAVGGDGGEQRPDDAAVSYLAVDGLHCSACEAFVESVAAEEAGVYDVSVNYATDTAKVAYDPAVLDGGDVPEAVSTLGYHARFPDDDGATGGTDAWDGRRVVAGSVAGMLVMLAYGTVLYPSYLVLSPAVELAVLAATLVLGTVYCAVALFVATGPVRATVALFALQAVAFLAILGKGALSVGATVPAVAVLGAVVVFYTGAPFLRGAYVSVRGGRPNMDLLVALAVLAAYGYSLVAAATGGAEVYFDVAVMVVLVVALGNRLEARAKRRATRDLSAVADTRVEAATRRRPDGTTETVPVEELSGGDAVVVAAGERVPVDGEVLAGTAAVDESLLTGEALPTTKRPGDDVVGGSVVTDDRLVVEAGDGADSTLDRLVDLLWEARSGRSGVQQYADRLAAVFVPLVVLLAAATAGFHLDAGAPVGEAVLTGVAVLVVSCPCALGLATPLAVAAGVRASLAAGVVVTDGSLFERVVDADVVVLDKTGTLTTGEMGVVDVVTGDADRGDLLATAAAVEQHSRHPVAAAVADHADPEAAAVSEFETRPRGVAAQVDGRDVQVGHPDIFGDGWRFPDELRAAARGDDRAVPVVVGWDGVVRGVLRVADDPRPEWRAAVDALAGPDREVVVLTGDRAAGASAFRDHPAVDEVFAGVPPGGKASTVERLRERGTVAMVGDGSNDAPALAAADLGVAMASGTELAADAADAVVTADDLRAVPRLFGLAEATRSRVRQNLGWALTYNAVAIPLAATGLLNPLFAAVAMAASSLLVVGNSARSLDDGGAVGPSSGVASSDAGSAGHPAAGTPSD
jgi:Cu2+-exporting ATPase